MKFKREVPVPVFEPITITIETIEELKWLTSIANTSEGEARNQARELGFDLGKGEASQMNLWDGLSQYKDLLK